MDLAAAARPGGLAGGLLTSGLQDSGALPHERLLEREEFREGEGKNALASKFTELDTSPHLFKQDHGPPPCTDHGAKVPLAADTVPRNACS